MTAIDDEHAVIKTLYMFNHAYDDGGIEAALAFYAEDCTLELKGFPTGGVFRGHDGVRSAHSHEDLQPWEAEWFGGGRLFAHMCLQPVVSVEGDRASAHSDYLMLRADEPPPAGGARVLLFGRQHDQLRRHRDGWLIARRQIVAYVPGIPREHNPPVA